MSDSEKNTISEQIRVLILEDNYADAELIKNELRGVGIPFTSRVVSDKASYIKAIQKFRPDIILSDYVIPSFSGSEALQIRNQICPDLPFILVTGAIGEEQAIEILTGGATDFVLKGNLSRFLPALHRALHEAHERRKRKIAEAERDSLLKELEIRVQERTEALELEIKQRKKAEQETRNSEEKIRQAHFRLRELTNRMTEIREEERAAMARELHDELGQVLSGFRMDLSWILKRLPAGRDDLIGKAQFMKSYIDPAIELIRRISTELRPGILDDLGLVATIEWQLQVFRNRTGIDCDFDSYVDESGLGDRLKTALFRVVQESMTNIMKHAEATSLRISIVEDSGDLTLRIADNGKGIRYHDLRKKNSTGLRGIKERLAYFDGKLTVKGEPGKGTVLEISIPRAAGDLKQNAAAG